MSEQRSIKYRPEIDGLRALAVIPVVLFHLGLSFPGGFTGVDVFFVISGFLICGIILRELDEKKFSMLRFYERRVRRIMPAFFAVIFAALVLAALILYPGDFDMMGHHLSYISLFASNIQLSLFEGGYWAADAKTFPLLHTWSLAVEEQFYFVMPVILLALHRWLKKHLFGAFLLLFFLSLGYCIYATQASPQQAFYLLPSRAWEMLLGGMVYLLIQRDCPWGKSAALGGVMGGVGLLLMVGSYFTITGAMTFPGYIALFPTVGTALFIYSNSWDNNWTGRLLAWSPLQFIGKISYSLYLWHWPLIIFLKAHRYPDEIGMIDKLALLVVAFIVSILSWKFIEQPFRHPAKRNSAVKAIVPACILLVLMFGVSLVIRKCDGFPGRLPWLDGDVVTRVKMEQKALGLTGRPPLFDVKRKFSEGGYQVNVGENEIPNIVVLGDSHAAMFGVQISKLSDEYGIPITFFTHSGTKPFFNTNKVTDRLIDSFIREWRPSAIILVMRMDSGIETIETSLEYAKHCEAALRNLSENCERLYFVLQTPKSVGFNLSRELALQHRDTIRLLVGDSDNLPRIVDEPVISRLGRQKTRDWVESLDISNLKLLDTGKYLLKHGQVVITDKGRLLYLDDDHLSNFGAAFVSPLFHEVFEGVSGSGN